MAAAASKAIIRLGFCLLTMLLACSAQLSPDFYERSCPKALSIIRNVVRNAVYMEHRMGASLLRLHFHDCFVIGCDASVLLDDTPNFTGEKTAGPNANSLRGFEVIDKIKSQLENICPGVVSCADIVAAAAQDSVAILGGPSWEVELGRRDSTNASYNGASTDLPSPLMDLNDLISSFSKKGFTAKEMVALSGAHTIGKARCLLFRDRIYNESNIDPTFALMLKATCPSSGSDNNNSSLDSTSPDRFDSAYFRNLIENKGVLHSDQQLFNGSSTDSQVRSYASNFGRFYVDFANAMVKMGSLNTLTGSAGQIRTNCRKLN